MFGVEGYFLIELGSEGRVLHVYDSNLEQITVVTRVIVYFIHPIMKTGLFGDHPPRVVRT